MSPPVSIVEDRQTGPTRPSCGRHPSRRERWQRPEERRRDSSVYSSSQLRAAPSRLQSASPASQSGSASPESQYDNINEGVRGLDEDTLSNRDTTAYGMQAEQEPGCGSQNERQMRRRPEPATSRSDSPEGESSASWTGSGSLIHAPNALADLSASGTATPPSMEQDRQVASPSAPETPDRIPRRFALEANSAQDASLPSPCLSPVTAAAEGDNEREYFERLPARTGSAGTSFDNDQAPSQESQDISQTDTQYIDAEDGSALVGMPRTPAELETLEDDYSTLSLLDIPKMLNSFDTIPSEMQQYIMHHLLRRCPKSVLHFVANVVNPALQIDFLSLLPTELCLNIISHLDCRSLCNAAQVSKRWRKIIDSEEGTWKRLFDADGYTLTGDELRKGIREGWCWQYTSRLGDWEKDLSTWMVNTSDSEGAPAAFRFESLPGESAAPPLRRPKRKAVTKTKVKPRKQQKREDWHSDNRSLDVAQERFSLEHSPSEGPYAAANAAAISVPNADIGLPSLRNLHLFKSLYRRHHLIRRSWMEPATKPRHLAFRAHQRHVVTCLQFDGDKILTGSDDKNINVYDTQTGRLKEKLEGHDGGVWALQYEGNILVSGSTDRSVRVWDIEKGRCSQVFQGHTSTVRCLQILMPTKVDVAPDGKAIMMPEQPLIITGSRDSTLRVWKLPKAGEPDYFQAGPPENEADCPYFVRVLAGHHHSVRAIAAHADTLVSGSYDHSVRVWQISTGETLHRLQGHTQKVYSVVLDHRRNRCISGSMDNLVKVWSLETGSVLFNLEGHSSLVGLLDLQQDRLVSAAADFTLRIWDPENGHCKSTLSAHTNAITCFQHDGQKVISGSDRTLKMWDVTNGQFVKDLLTDLSGVWQVKFNERRCVAAVQRNNLTYIEVRDHQPVFKNIQY